MKTLRAAVLASPLALALACGGSGSGATGSSSELLAAAPTSETFAVSVTDTTPAPAALSTANLDPVVAFPPIFVGGGDACHPHLFQRTEAVAARLNRHLYKFLGRIDRLIADDPTVSTSSQVVWERVRNGLDERFTLTQVATGQYTWSLDLRQGSTGSFTTVFSGEIDRTTASGPHQGKGDMTLDLTALQSVIPTEPASGVIQVTFDVEAAQRLEAFDASGVTWDTNGDPDDLPAKAPRDAHYVLDRVPGKGGSLKAADEMIFLCPANPQGLQASVELVSRWYVLTDGSQHGRSDALMTGGQLTSTQSFVGLTCHEKPAAGQPVESYWLMKLEDGGTVVSGSAHQGGTGTPCDPVFGSVPALDSTAGDFDFTQVNFTDDDPYPFPTP